MQVTVTKIGSRSFYISNRRAKDPMVDLVVEVQCRDMHPLKRNGEKHSLTYIVVMLGTCKWCYAWQALQIIINETFKTT